MASLHPQAPASTSLRAPSDESHRRGLHEVTATVVDLTRPSPHTLRVVARLNAGAGDPQWAEPNPAFRIQIEDGASSVSRVYTVRSFAAAAGCLEFDVVVHGHSSPMMRWARRAQVGDLLDLTGPRANIALPPAATQRPVALFLDDSALPALYSTLQQWPAGATGEGWIATDDTHALTELPAVPGLQLHQVPVQGQPPQPLLHHARLLPGPAGYVVWGAGERDEMRALRQYFQSEVGLPKSDMAIAGYWKRGASNTEIDVQRQDGYRRFIAAGGALADWDDLSTAL